MDKVWRFTEGIYRKTSGDIPYWIAACLTGLIAVGYAQTFQAAEDFSRNIMINHPLWFLGVAPLCFFGSWFLVFRFAPEAKGSGIPQVMAAIESEKGDNGVFFERLLGFKTLTIKVVSSLFCVLGGGAVGREGPTIQIAASVFHFVNRFSRKFSFSVNYHFGLIAGGAAGIAAAFNTPLGGLVFAIEELATSHFNKFKTSLISGVIISGLVAQLFTGTYLYLGYPAISSTGTASDFWAFFVGMTAGLFGALFGKLLYFLSVKRSAVTSPLRLAFFAAGCGLLLGLLSLYVDNRMAGPGRETVVDLLFKDSSHADFKLAVGRFFSPMISYLSGGAGGIFAPSLAAGGSIGGFLASWLDPLSAHLFILTGMIGFLTGVTRAPFTSFVLVLEMTDRHSAIFPMMIAALGSSFIAKLVEPESFYEHIKKGYLAVESNQNQ